MARKAVLERDVLAVQVHLLKEEQPDASKVSIQKQLGIKNGIYYEVEKLEVNEVSVQLYHKLTQSRKAFDELEKQSNRDLEDIAAKRDELRAAVATLPEKTRKILVETIAKHREEAKEAEKKEQGFVWIWSQH